jgi:hypothetical protein
MIKIFEFIQPYASVLADIATIIGGISVTIGIFSLVVNRVNKKSFRLEVNSLRSNYGDALFRISVQNFTDKLTCIIEIKLIIKNQTYKAIERHWNSSDFFYKDFRNIQIFPFESKDFELLFYVEKNTLPKYVKFKVLTTQKNISYKVDLSKIGNKRNNT